MARSVLWIDAREVAILLGEAMPAEQAAAEPRRFRARDGGATEPYQREHAARPQHDSAPPMGKLAAQLAPAPTSPPPKVAAEPVHAPPPLSTKPGFMVARGGLLETELDRILDWIETRHATTCCYIADQDGLLVAARNIATASSPYQASGLWSSHLDEISAHATAPLRGYWVFRTAQGYSTSTWTERDGRRFFLVLECERALGDGEVALLRTALSELFKESK